MITDGNLKDTVIRILRSRVAGRTPTAAAEGELAINETDEILYYRKADGLIPFKSQNKQTCADVAPTQGTDSVTDNTDIITSHADGYSNTNNKTYRRKASLLWNYVKSKIESVLGLTAQNYGGTATQAKKIAFSVANNESTSNRYHKIGTVVLSKNEMTKNYVDKMWTLSIQGSHSTSKTQQGIFSVSLTGTATYGQIIPNIYIQSGNISTSTLVGEYVAPTAETDGAFYLYVFCTGIYQRYDVQMLRDGSGNGRTFVMAYENATNQSASVPRYGGVRVESTYASRAHADTSGNVIEETYVKKADQRVKFIGTGDYELNEYTVEMDYDLIIFKPNAGTSFRILPPSSVAVGKRVTIILDTVGTGNSSVTIDSSWNWYSANQSYNVASLSNGAYGTNTMTIYGTQNGWVAVFDRT